MRKLFHILYVPILFILLFLVGCQTNNFDPFKSFHTNINSEQIKSIEKKYASRKNPKYDKFLSRNAEKNVKKAILSHPLFIRNLVSLEIAKSNKNVVRSAKETQINIQAIGGFARQDEDNELGVSSSVNVTRLIHDYGAVDQSIKAEEQKIIGAQYEIKNQAENIALTAYQNWINLSVEQKILSFYDESVSKAAPLVEKIDQISLSGIADSTMILKARKEYSELELKLKNAEVREITSRESFKNIFNISSIQKLDLLKPKEIKSYKYHESSMIKNSPILNGQRSVIKSLDISKASLEAQKKPNISLKAGVNAPADNPVKNGSANVGFLMNYIYDDGGKLDSQIETIENRIKYYQNDYDNSLKNLKLELSRSYKTYLGAKDTRDKLRELVILSKKVRDNLNNQLSTGRAKLQDILSAEVNLANNEILLMNADRELILSSFKIVSLSTGLFPNVKWH